MIARSAPAIRPIAWLCRAAWVMSVMALGCSLWLGRLPEYSRYWMWLIAGLWATALITVILAWTMGCCRAAPATELQRALRTACAVFGILAVTVAALWTYVPLRCAFWLSHDGLTQASRSTGPVSPPRRAGLYWVDGVSLDGRVPSVSYLSVRGGGYFVYSPNVQPPTWRSQGGEFVVRYKLLSLGNGWYAAIEVTGVV